MLRLITLAFIAVVATGCSTVCIPVEGHDHSANSRASKEKVCTIGWRVNDH